MTFDGGRENMESLVRIFLTQPLPSLGEFWDVQTPDERWHEVLDVLTAYGQVIFSLHRFEMFMLTNANEALHVSGFRSHDGRQDMLDLRKKTMGQLRRILLDRRMDLDRLEDELKQVLDLRNFLIHTISGKDLAHSPCERDAPG